MDAKNALRAKALIFTVVLGAFAACGDDPPPTPDSGTPRPPDAGAPSDATRPDAPEPDAAAGDRRPLVPMDLAPVLTTDAPPANTSGVSPEGMCPVNPRDLDGWFPITPPIVYFKPLPHPESECPFYIFNFQHFLLATQPRADGTPAFLHWPTIENTFGRQAGEPPPEIPVLTGGVRQAGARQALVDQNGNAIYYGLHLNQRFVNFVYENKLTTAEAIQNADPNLAFDSPDIVTLKSAWMIVDPAAPPANFLVAKVRVPTLKIVEGKPTEDYSKLRDVTVALLALHVVFTMPGHPEFVWGTFEHVNGTTGITDVAPSARTQPGAGTGEATIISQTGHLLYKAGATVAVSNKPVATPSFDEATQKFAVDQATSIYRVFPGSLSHKRDQDEDVVALNENMLARYKAEPKPDPNDKRVNYLMVGTIWLDRPDETFLVNKELINDYSDVDIQRRGPESPNSITGGEDRLSSTSMESFTQAGESFPNCFSCHDTRGATVSGIPQQRDMLAEPLLGPKRIGVSHVFNEVLRLKP